MEREIIVDIRPWDIEFATAAIEAGVRKIIIPKNKTNEAHKLGRIITISKDGDIKLGKEIIEMEIRGREDEERILRAAKAVELLEEDQLKIKLVEATIIDIITLGKADRCCIDTSNLMVNGQGMLIGLSSEFLFLIHSESIESVYCDARPFRVNAGAMCNYILINGNRTKYLSEVDSGIEVLIVDAKGNTKIAIVGRNKIEERPILLIEAEAKGIRSFVMLQNAETIRLVQKGGGYKSVVELKPGDKILVKVGKKGKGRHFGREIDEKIKE